ncbi:EAL domain-containing protein [Pseudoroseomonas cervicalis]|uniref:two-component system response regulator n=1 Tax=Teichococcus cervicalis TaxID=204525 RepID=UPI0022F17B66|nr:EAL domain-containing protein [Pseudoroseomonas cervicalis]WBV41930.1 EAL domain-containing protein [Pseudoroseomonas cervicalis]
MATILILDDRSTNRDIFSRLALSLERDVQVEAFGDPQAALDWLAGHEADLVVTDFRMPGMDGAEFTRRLRALPPPPGGAPGAADAPVIVITAYNDRAYRMRALEAGATDFLLSPVDHYEFLTRARNLLRMRWQQQVIQRRAESLEQALQHSTRAREEMLRDSRAALAQVIDTVPAMISAADRQGRCVFVNAAQAEFAGTTPEALAGQPVERLFSRERAARSRALDALVFETGQPLPGREEETEGPDGQARIFSTTKAPLHNARGEVVAVLTTSLEITDRKLAERRLGHMAHHDALTGLPNRAFLRDRLRRELARGRRGDHAFALLFLDLDRFKAVNDALGHHVGDALLRTVAQRLKATARAEDLVARLGGDEFAIVQTAIQGPEDAAALAQRIMAALAAPVEADGHNLSAAASIGITLSPRDGADPDELLRNADLAMYRAKAEGRHGWRFFAAAMDARAREAMQIEAELRAALGRGEFELHYQPQVELRGSRVTGAEALLRWRRHGHGLCGPGSFLAIAEETGLIVPINEWVLREACRQAAAWAAEGLPPVRMGVNLSPVQFRRQDVRGLVAQVLRETGLPPDRLDLELTEGILMEQDAATASGLQALRALGVRISVDDFGTGYSSLNYVKNFPVDRLKIDQSFVRGMTSEPNDAAIVRTIVDLGHMLRLQVVAEGVETEAQLARLRAEGCDEVQGFYYSEALPAEGFARLLRQPGARPRSQRDQAEWAASGPEPRRDAAAEAVPAAGGGARRASGAAHHPPGQG